MRSVALGEYRNLMHAFSSGLISASEFQDSYAKLANADKASRPEEIALILSALSADLAALADKSPIERMNEASLRVRVTEGLRVLDAIKHGSV